jgi:hypothetical protein
MFPPDRRWKDCSCRNRPEKNYRLLKIVTQPATPEQAARLGNDRAPVIKS